jgi:hypothetical protein
MMETVFWLDVALSVAAVLATLGFAGIVRRRRVSVPKLVEIRVGAFDEIVALRLPPPEHALSVARHEGQTTPSSGLALPAPTTAGSPDRGGVDRVAWASALADGIAPAIGVWEKWSAVDEHVFQAFAHLAHERVNGVADLLRIIDAKGYAIESEGFARKLLGHLGEWHVHDHLIQAGVDVAMPATSNAPGLDLWANGHAMNVKTVKDAATAASAHFADHPDIPIVLPGDAADIPADALHFDPSEGFDTAVLAGSDHVVVVDDALSHADIVDQTHHLRDLAGDPGPDIGFPWVTATMSGFREVRLLVKGHTDIVRATKNVAVDTAAVGGGSAIGLKTGALIGSAFGPLGTIAGGLAGGLLGALGGRVVANEVKRAPFEAAKSRYEAALRTYREVEASLVVNVGTRWEQAREEQTRSLQTSLSRLRHDFETAIAELRDRLRDAVRLDLKQAEVLLASVRGDLSQAVKEDRTALRADVPVFLSPWAGLFAPEAAQRLRRHQRELSVWCRATDSLLSGWTGSDADTSRCFDLSMATPKGTASAEAHVKRTQSVRKSVFAQAANRQQMLLADATLARRDAVTRLQDHWEQIRVATEDAMRPAVSSLRVAGEELRQELRKNGMAV